MGIEPLHPDGTAKTVAAVIMTDYSPPERLVAKFSPDSRTAPAASQGQTQFAQTLSND
jgi:hypothetical protein